MALQLQTISLCRNSIGATGTRVAVLDSPMYTYVDSREVSNVHVRRFSLALQARTKILAWVPLYTFDDSQEATWTCT